MGRHAGWLAGAAALATAYGAGPDLVYLPEVDFDMDQFFVYHVPQRDDDTGMGIFRVGGVEVFVDRNKADITDAEILLDVIAGVDGVPSQTGKVFDNHAVYMTGLNIREHLLKARTVEVCAGITIVLVIMAVGGNPVILAVAFQNLLLVRYGVTFTIQLIFSGLSSLLSIYIGMGIVMNVGLQRKISSH